MAEYKLSYTAAEIDQKIGKVGQLSTDVSGLQTDTASLQSNVKTLQTDVQTKAEIVTLTTAEYEELEANSNTNANALYMLTDSEDEVVQSDWNQTDETALDFIKNKPNIATDDEIIEMLTQEDMFPVVTDADGSILSDENDNILLW